MELPPNHKHEFRRSLLVRPPDDQRWFEPGFVLCFGLGDAPSRVQRLQDLVQAAGMSSADAFRARFQLPPGYWLCRPMLPLEGAPVRCELDPLHAALLLGLCGLACYAPDRPLILTESRLSRQLQLHRVDEFYRDS